ncbi:MAG: hypothetical protein R3C13_00370 [Hyphomonas sp.]|uniref:hypothetical protein n=1 Tax=Hyphomonas sp. TaxID=87 RepID=UPI003527C239
MRGIWIFILAGASAAGTAQAGPWAQPPGHIYVRSLVSAERLNQADGWRGDLYAEYGARSRWSLSGKLEAVRYDGESSGDRESYRVGLRRELWSGASGWSIGAELAALNGSALAGLRGCNGWGGEARLSAGRSGLNKGRPYYIFADVAAISHDDGCTRQRLDLGFGTDIGRRFFTMQQLWIENGNYTADSVKIDTQYGYHFRAFDLSIGYRHELGGEFKEHAVLAGITVRK